MCAQRPTRAGFRGQTPHLPDSRQLARSVESQHGAHTLHTGRIALCKHAHHRHSQHAPQPRVRSHPRLRSCSQRTGGCTPRPGPTDPLRRRRPGSLHGADRMSTVSRGGCLRPALPPPVRPPSPSGPGPLLLPGGGLPSPPAQRVHRHRGAHTRTPHTRRRGAARPPAAHTWRARGWGSPARHPRAAIAPTSPSRLRDTVPGARGAHGAHRAPPPRSCRRGNGRSGPAADGGARERGSRERGAGWEREHRGS